MILLHPREQTFRNIVAELVANGTPFADSAAEIAFRTWFQAAWLDSGCTPNFLVLRQPATTTTIQFDVRVAATGHKINVWWGDSTSNSYSPTNAANTACAKTYGVAALRAVVILGSATRFESTHSDGRTNFGGRISTMRTLTNLNWGGNNTGTGSITGMPLTVLAWGGGNTGTGSITGMSLAYLNWSGNNTGSGSVTGMPLAFLAWGGNNTGSGSVTGMPLTSLLWTGSNTGTGWGSVAASATGLCRMVHGGLTVLDAAEVNAVLAGFWANRNAAKSRADRVIDLGKDTPSPNAAPTGQGITDRDALRLYRSPTPPGTAALWTVTTN
jgi:hypothetical protein